jgi:hypothetical protein
VHTIRLKIGSLIALGATIALVTLLTAPTASARSLASPRTATRGPAPVTDYKPRQSTTPTDFGWVDGILVGSFLLAVALAVGYAFSSQRERGRVEGWNIAPSAPTTSNGRPDPTSQASRPATSRS